MCPILFAAFTKGWVLFIDRTDRQRDEKNYPSAPLKLNPLSDFQQQQSAVPAAERDDINRGNESHEPSGGLLAGGHPLPSFRPHKNRNCISRNAATDEHPRPASQKPGETSAGRPSPFAYAGEKGRTGTHSGQLGYIRSSRRFFGRIEVAARVGFGPSPATLPLGLRSALESGNCVLFIGAGLGEYRLMTLDMAILDGRVSHACNGEAQHDSIGGRGGGSKLSLRSMGHRPPATSGCRCPHNPT